MRFLYHHRTASKDGQSVHIDSLIAALRTLGHQVELVEPPAASSAAFGGKPGPLDWLRRCLPRLVYELLEIAYNLPVYWRLRAAVRRFKPDVLYERHHLYLYAGAWIARRYRLPYLLEVNSPLAVERHRTERLALPRFAAASERWVWRQADAVLPVTGVLAQHLRGAGVRAPRLHVIPNGIDPQLFARAPDTAAAQRALGLGGAFDGPLVIGFTGFVRDWNALERVLDSMTTPALAHAVLLLVGDGPARPALERAAAERGLSHRVRFLGVIERTRIAQVVAAFDIAVLPAVNPYASPLKLFEYLALGRCVVAPDQPNLREILTDGRDALLFDPSSPVGLALVLARAGQDSALRARLGRAAARLIAERRLTWHQNAERVAGIALALRPPGGEKREPSLWRSPQA